MGTLEMTTVDPPHKISELLYAHRATEALKVAVELGIFDKLLKQAMSAEQLAPEISVDKHACEVLLNALSSLQLLEKKNSVFGLAEMARLYLCRESSLFMGDLVTDERVARAWSNLKEVIKTGKPLNQVNKVEKAEEFFPKLAASIFPLNYGTAHAVATELKIEQYPAGARALDVAAGSAVWSLPLAERNKDLHVDAIDFPAVLKVTREFAERHGVGARFSYLAGNWSDCSLEAESYDVILLGHILHSEGKARSEELLKECYRCLKKGGKLVLAEMISDDEFSRQPGIQLFALNMLLMTESGCIFSEGELRAMLSAQGFHSICRPAVGYLPEESPVMIATK